MSSLFPLSAQTALSAVLHKLHADTKPGWGIMNAQEMIEHLDLIVQYSYSGEQLRVFAPEDQMEKLKKFLWSDKPLPKLFKNPAMDDVVAKHPDLETAISSLHKTLAAFHLYFEQHPSYETTHPVFGMLDHEGWLRFHQKHFEHHFTQFSIL